MNDDQLIQTARRHLKDAQGEQAFAIAEQVLAGNPDSVTAGIVRAEALLVMGRPEDAADAIESLVSQHPHEASANEAAAHLLRAIGRTEEAVGYATRAENLARLEESEQVIAASKIPEFTPLTDDEKKSLMKEFRWRIMGLMISISSFMVLGNYTRAMRPMFDEQQKNPNKMMSLEEMTKFMTPEIQQYVLISLALWGASLAWFIFDFYQKPTPNGWKIAAIATHVLCCLGMPFGPGWFLIPIYLIARPSPLKKL